MGNQASHDKMVRKNGATLKIEVFEAQCLKDTSNTLATQSPYVLATCLPYEKSSTRTEPCPSGAAFPRWDPKLRNMLNLRPDMADTSVLLEVKSANFLMDEVLGWVEINFQEFMSVGQRIWLQLEPGGVLEVKVTGKESLFPPQKPPSRKKARRPEEQVEESSETPKVLSLEVHGAEEIPNIQLIGTQDPYICLWLMPGKHLGAKTLYVWDGGENPDFDPSHRNVLSFVPDRKEHKRLLLEVWNANFILDEMIGNVEFSIDYEELDRSGLSRLEFQLDNGGTVFVTMSWSHDGPQRPRTRQRIKLSGGSDSGDPVTENNVALSMRVTAGPDWWNVNAADLVVAGGGKEAGTVVAFRKGDSSIMVKKKQQKKKAVALMMEQLEAYSCIVVWDCSPAKPLIHRCGDHNTYHLQIVGLGQALVPSVTGAKEKGKDAASVQAGKKGRRDTELAVAESAAMHRRAERARKKKFAGGEAMKKISPQKTKKNTKGKGKGKSKSKDSKTEESAADTETNRAEKDDKVVEASDEAEEVAPTGKQRVRKMTKQLDVWVCEEEDCGHKNGPMNARCEACDALHPTSDRKGKSPGSPDGKAPKKKGKSKVKGKGKAKKDKEKSNEVGGEKVPPKKLRLKKSVVKKEKERRQSRHEGRAENKEGADEIDDVDEDNDDTALDVTLDLEQQQSEWRSNMSHEFRQAAAAAHGDYSYSEAETMKKSKKGKGKSKKRTEGKGGEVIGEQEKQEDAGPSATAMPLKAMLKVYPAGVPEWPEAVGFLFFDFGVQLVEYDAPRKCLEQWTWRKVVSWEGQQMSNDPTDMEVFSVTLKERSGNGETYLEELEFDCSDAQLVSAAFEETRATWLVRNNLDLELYACDDSEGNGAGDALKKNDRSRDGEEQEREDYSSESSSDDEGAIRNIYEEQAQQYERAALERQLQKQKKVQHESENESDDEEGFGGVRRLTAHTPVLVDVQGRQVGGEIEDEEDAEVQIHVEDSIDYDDYEEDYSDFEDDSMYENPMAFLHPSHPSRMGREGGMGTGMAFSMPVLPECLEEEEEEEEEKEEEEEQGDEEERRQRESDRKKKEEKQKQEDEEREKMRSHEAQKSAMLRQQMSVYGGKAKKFKKATKKSKNKPKAKWV